MNIAIFALGSFLLIAGVVLGYWRWVQPYQTQRGWQVSGLLLLTILTMMGGFIGAFAWWFDEKYAFAWDLPPLASRMLASAGWAFAALSLLVLQHPSVRRLRLLLIALLVYLLPLTIAILAMHLDRFDFGEPITYGFFTIVVTMLLADAWYLWRQPLVIPDDAQDYASPSVLVKYWLGGVALLTFLWGVALFLTSDAGSDKIWLWAGDLLTSQLIGVMLLTIAAGALYSLRFADTSRLTLTMILVYGVGAAMASWANTLSDKPIKMSYLVVFAILGLVSGGILLVDYQRRRIS